MVSIIPRILYALNLFVNVILILSSKL